MKLDVLKHALKTARNPRVLSKVSEIYDVMKLKMAGKLVNLHKKIERLVHDIISDKGMKKDTIYGNFCSIVLFSHDP